MPISGSKRTWIAIVGGVAVLALGGAVGWLLLSGDDTPVVAETVTTAVDDTDEDLPDTAEPAPESTTTAAVMTSTTTTSPPDPGTTTTLAATITLASAEVSAAASSFLPNDNDPDRYAPSQTLDGRLETAWNHCGTGCPNLSGDARQGVGVVLTYSFDEPSELVAIRIANGYQKISNTVGDVWPKNNRIASLDIRTESGSTSVILTDERGYQEIPASLGITGWVELTVTAVYLGDGTYNDLAVSEIEFVVRRVSVGA